MQVFPLAGTAQVLDWRICVLCSFFFNKIAAVESSNHGCQEWIAFETRHERCKDSWSLAGQNHASILDVVFFSLHILLQFLALRPKQHPKTAISIPKHGLKISQNSISQDLLFFSGWPKKTISDGLAKPARKIGWIGRVTWINLKDQILREAECRLLWPWFSQSEI